MCPTSEIAIRELDHRTNDGIDVRLLWNSQTNRVVLAVEDERNGESFEIEVAGADALEAFRHPYAHATRAYDEKALSAERLRSSPNSASVPRGKEQR